MIVVQAVPPVPPTPPSIPVDINPLLMQLDSPAIVMVVLLITVAVTLVCWPIARAIARRLEGKPSVDPGAPRRAGPAAPPARGRRPAAAAGRRAGGALDFTERLLARGESQATLPRGGP
jgi:hypothetical protein